MSTRTVKDVSDFFKSVKAGDGMVWAKSVSSRGGQTIIEVRDTNGDIVPVPPVKSGDPVCLSEFAEIELLEKCRDIKSCAVAGLLQLMTEDEANAWFAKKGARLRKSPDELKRKARNQSQLEKDRPSPVEADESKKVLDREPVKNLEDTINRRLVYICGRLSPMLTENQRISASDAMNDLMEIEDGLEYIEWAYLAQQGYYPSIIKYAKEMMDSFARETGMLPTTDELMGEES